MPDNTSPTTATPDPVLTDLPPSGGDTSVRYPSPIGVPQYTVDPRTGQIATDQSGNPIPWFGSKPGGPTIPNVFAGTGGSMGVDFFGAQYHDGDEWAVIGNLPPEVRSEVQQAMLDRGLFGAKRPNVAMGSWDNESASAFKQVLAYANATGKDWQDALQEMPVVQADDLTERKVVQIKLTNPTDLAQIFKNAAADLIGGTDVPQEDVDAFVRAYQAQEKEAQQAAIAQQRVAQQNSQVVRVDPDGNVLGQPAGTDFGVGALPDSAAGANVAVQETDAVGNDIITTTDAPSAANVAAEEIKKKYAGRYGATQLARQFDNFLSILSGAGGGSTQGTAT